MHSKTNELGTTGPEEKKYNIKKRVLKRPRLYLEHCTYLKTTRSNSLGKFVCQNANRFLWISSAMSGWPLISDHFVKYLRELTSIHISAIVGFFGRFEVELNLVLSGDLFLARGPTITRRTRNPSPSYVPSASMNGNWFIKQNGKFLTCSALVRNFITFSKEFSIPFLVTAFNPNVKEFDFSNVFSAASEKAEAS